MRMHARSSSVFKEDLIAHPTLTWVENNVYIYIFIHSNRDVSVSGFPYILSIYFISEIKGGYLVTERQHENFRINIIHW